MAGSVGLWGGEELRDSFSEAVFPTAVAANSGAPPSSTAAGLCEVGENKMNTRGNDEGETNLNKFTAGGDSTAEMLELATSCSGQERMAACTLSPQAPATKVYHKSSS